MQKKKNPTDILYRLRGLCRRHETKGNKKPPVQNVQTVAEPHSPSLYGESISASFTTPLGCTQSRRNFGYKLPTEAQSIYNNSGELSMQKNKNPTRYLVSVAWIVQTARNKRQ